MELVSTEKVAQNPKKALPLSTFVSNNLYSKLKSLKLFDRQSL
jgi:hypothetical protein